jgi:hypothetical protein
MGRRTGAAAMAAALCGVGLLSGCRPPTPPPPTTPTPTLPQRDCLAHDTGRVTITDQGSAGWRLEDGSQWILVLDNRTDAEQALALARQAGTLCYIGRGNSRANRRDYIAEYWITDHPPLGALPHAEDCLSYNRSALRVENLGATGWRLTDGVQAMVIYDNQADADEGLAVARANTRQCFIGRGNARPNRIDYIVQYWR